MLNAIVLCRNEEENIVNCLNSLSFCDEIIVINDLSKDKTTKLIKNLKNSKITIFDRPLNSDFSNQRNYGLSKAKGDWVLFIDADEIVCPALAFEISNAIAFSSQYNGFFIKRVDIMWGKKIVYGESGIKLIRLVKKTFGKWEGKVHESMRVKGKVGTLNNILFHYPHKNISNFLREINFYTTLRAEELYKMGKRVTILSILFFPLGKFLSDFFLKRGFQDGMPGLIVTLIMSFHSFLVRGKLWLLYKR